MTAAQHVLLTCDHCRRAQLLVPADTTPDARRHAADHDGWHHHPDTGDTCRVCTAAAHHPHPER